MSRLVFSLLGALMIVGCQPGGSLPAADVDADTNVSGDDTWRPPTDATRDTGVSDTGVSADAAPDTQPPPNCSDPKQSACGQRCVNLQSDPNNCGQCGRTCVLPHAKATCQQGSCAIDSCDSGFSNPDGEVANGCEMEGICQEGMSCQTSCGSEGTTVCQGSQKSCKPPEETCNLSDDDCDGKCESGLSGCRRGIHRGQPSAGGHIFTDDMSAIAKLEVANFFYLYDKPPANAPVTLEPVFLCTKGDGKKFLTSKTTCEKAGSRDKQLGFWASSAACGAVPLYRLYSSSAGNRFYTTSEAEKDKAVREFGYRFERIAGYVWKQP